MPGTRGTASTTFTVQVTYGSLCFLTKQFIQHSARHAALSPRARAAVGLLGAHRCEALSSARLAPTGAQKAALIVAYRKGTAALVPLGWLTQSQAAILANLANSL